MHTHVQIMFVDGCLSRGTFCEHVVQVLSKYTEKNEQTHEKCFQCTNHFSNDRIKQIIFHRYYYRYSTVGRYSYYTGTVLYHPRSQKTETNLKSDRLFLDFLPMQQYEAGTFQIYRISCIEIYFRTTRVVCHWFAMTQISSNVYGFLFCARLC